jgi:hypothetical protein
LTERYEFHKSKYSVVSNTSFIYMLQEVQNLELDQLEAYLQTDEKDNQKSVADSFLDKALADFDTTKSSNKNQRDISRFSANSLTGSFAGGDSTRIDKFRLQISLGSTVDGITEVSADGFTVTYAHGDVCDTATGQRFVSTVKYICDKGALEDEDADYEMPSYEPKMPTIVPSKEGGVCFFSFEWVSKYACA